MRNNNTLIENFIFNASYRILVMFIPLITTPYIARVLGAEGIGRYTVAFSVASYFCLFILLGVENYGNRTIAAVRDNKSELKNAFWEMYTLQLMLAVIATIMYIFYVKFFSSDIKIAAIMVIYIFSEMIDINWAFFGLEKFKLITMRNAFVKFASVICIFSFVKSEADVINYALINVIGAFVSQIILWCTLHKYIGLKRIQIKNVKRHLLPNLKLFIPVVAVSLYTIMDKIMIGYMSVNAEVGFYESAEKIINIPNILVISLGTIMLPRISNLVAAGENEQSLRYLDISIQFAMFMVTSIGFGIIGVSEEFVPLFYGQGYEICIILFTILIPSRFFMAFANVIRTQYLIPFKIDTAYIISVIGGAITNLTFNILLIPRLGCVGAAYGTLASEAMVCLLQCYAVRQQLPIKKLSEKSVPFVVTGFVMCMTLKFIPVIGNVVLSLFLKILIGIVIYIGIIVPWVVLPYAKMRKQNESMD